MAIVVVVCGEMCGNKRVQKDKQKEANKRQKKQQKKTKPRQKRQKDRGPEGPTCSPQELEHGGHQPPKFYQKARTKL